MQLKELSDSLREFAGWHAERAFAGMNSSDRRVRLDAAMSAGVAIELTLKHLLALANPVLLAELKSDTAEAGMTTRLALSRDGHDLLDVRTCSATEAFNMAKSLNATMIRVSKAEFSQALNLRNAAAHLAVDAPAPAVREAVFTTLYLMFSVEHKGTPIVPWPRGSDERNNVEGFIAWHRQSRLDLVRRDIDHYKQQYSERSQSPGFADWAQRRASNFLDNESASLFDDHGRPFLTTPTQGTHKCIACGQQGVVLYEAQGEPVEDPGDPKSFLLGESWSILAFACHSCGLTLSLTALLTLERANDKWASHVTQSVYIPPAEHAARQQPREVFTTTPASRRRTPRATQG
ncbi:hypothetical protein [Blastococcus sp. SYSU D00695]